MRLLLIDDDRDEAEALKGFLGREGVAVDVATTTDAARVCLEEAAPDVVLSTLWVPPLTGLQMQAEIAQRCPSALRLMLFSRAELDAAITLAEDGETIRFLMRPWSEETLTALLWRFVSDKRLLELTGEGSAQGLSIEALCHQAHASRPGPPVQASPRSTSCPASTIVGGTLVRRGRIARLVTELADSRRVVVDVACSRGKGRSSAIAA